MSWGTKVDVNTSRAFTYHWLLWKAYGMEAPKRSSKWFKRYVAYAIILHFTILLFPLSLIVNLILSKNMLELCENLYNTITDLICNIKFYYVLVIRQRLLKVRGILERLDERAKTREEVAILEDGIASARKLFVFCFRVYCCAVIASEMIVLCSNGRTLMYPAWFPWDWRASKKNYLLAHSYQLYGLVLQSIQNLVNDTYPPAYFVILSAQIKALAARIKNLGNDGTSSSEDLYKELTNCIRDHNTIHELFLNIQKMVSTICLLQFAATGLAQCTMGVYMIYVGSDPSKLFHLFCYFAAITTEIFILCYYGDLYCQTNDHLTESIYRCNWMDRDEKFKKAFLFLLQRSQMPSTIMAGNLIPVRMPTFVKIIKTAYSVFTVLKETN